MLEIQLREAADRCCAGLGTWKHMTLLCMQVFMRREKGNGRYLLHVVGMLGGSIDVLRHRADLPLLHDL